MSDVEPWLRGPIEGVPPLVSPLLMSFQMAREDLRRYAGGLSPRQIWATPHGLPSVGFQLRHIAGSVDRLGTYLAGGLLNEAQLAILRCESEPGAGFDELIRGVEDALAACETTARSISSEEFPDPRYVGRRRLPTTVIGLIVHIAEHTQRHVGQAVTTAKLVAAMERDSIATEEATKP